ncbi:MAG: DUF1492 domain-containing protein [Oscillospiraceae bacterium]|nr:DUF1492 domain-containing protein [Oscillospiraceae bacterium]
MTAKEYLSQAYRLDQRIERKLEDRDRMRAKLVKATAQLTGMPRGSGTDWTDAAVRVMEYEQQIAAEIEELCRVKTEIRAVIDAVEDKRYRELLTARYLDQKRWEQIAVDMHYSYMQVHRLHKEALQSIRVPEEGNYGKA